jgi:F-type H+-transporting ATPase subunit epsilon
MPHSKFTVEVLTPEGQAFAEEVEMVSTRTTLGQIGILAHHAPVLATLEPTELRLYRSDSEIVRFAQAEGYLQVANNHVMVLVEEAVAPESLDAAALEQRLQEAERELDAAGDDLAKRRVAMRDKRRAEAFLNIAQGT